MTNNVQLREVNNQKLRPNFKLQVDECSYIYIFLDHFRVSPSTTVSRYGDNGSDDTTRHRHRSYLSHHPYRVLEFDNDNLTTF